ncbi:MAG: hypothetical protein FVQ81_09000 [Candidatus Glassbacteria bacterium]|nr:hypothetical protein [Candidatus Glassbacteria bacterium]
MGVLRRTITSQRGVALVTMLLLLSALTILSVGYIYVSSIDTQLAGNMYQNSRAFYAAEAGVEKALSNIQSLLDGSGAMTDDDLAAILPPDIDDFSWEEFSVVRADSSFVDTVTTGPYQGMVSVNQPITITSRVLGPRNSRYHIVVEVEGIQIPVFQFGVFYNDSLEIHNGPVMDFIGRIHTNSDLFLGTNSTTWFHKMITIAGDLYRFRIWNGETFGGSLMISDPDSNFVALTYDSQTYAGNDEGFVTQTTADFNGRLRTRAHNITPLGMPIAAGLDPIEIIQRRIGGDDASLVSERLDWKADTRIYADPSLSTVSIMNNDGNPKVLADPSAVYASYDAFYDDREGEWTDLMIIDVSKLTAADLGDGVIYVSIEEDPGRHKGIKLINAGSLPAPMTVASDNAIYIQGDYNTTSWQPSAIMGDAVILLSNSWVDADNANVSANTQVASSTTYYLAMISGDTPNASAYNGGLENFPRFLENWSGQTATIYGSMVNLFLSENAVGQWSYGDPVYRAPTRDWWFEVRFLDFNNLPPGTPSVGTVLRIAFRQEFFL